MSEIGSEQAGAERMGIADVPAVEVVLTVAMHLMSAATVACGLAEDEPDRPSPPADLAEARILITALAGLVTSAAPLVGSMHPAPLRDGPQALQRAFREASPIPDPPGLGPDEDLTGYVGEHRCVSRLALSGSSGLND